MIPLREIAVRIARTGVLAVVGASLFLLGCQSRMIYFPRAYEVAEVGAFVARGGVGLDFDTSHGRQRAFFRPGTVPGGRIWLFCPGNAMLGLDAEGVSRDWDAEAGWLFFDYPGYGGNAGRPHPRTIAENLSGAVGALAAHLGITPAALVPRLGAAGQSLGAAAALIAAEKFGLNRVVLISPFTSMTDMARLTVGWPLCHLNRHRFDNRRSLAAVSAGGARVWIVHGIDDEIIPISMARELAALSPASIFLTEVPRAGHNDLWDLEPEELRRVFRAAGAG